jgi:hypothetical protein
MPVTFANRNALDIEAVSLLGVNVKVTSNPFGFFGTGLKFAIAVLLRTGHRIEIYVNGKLHVLSLTEKPVRGVNFQVVTIDGKELGYTTEMGKMWPVWKAYRELSCNAMDEVDPYVGFAEIHPDDMCTVIRVYGSEIEQCHIDRAKYFCETKVIQRVGDYGEIREGKSKSIFYRGVAVHDLPTETEFTYNLLAPISLTEDRTMANSYTLPAKIGMIIAGVEDYGVIEKALMNKSAFEWSAEFGAVQYPSDAFMRCVETHKTNWDFNNSAKQYWQEQQPKEDPYKRLSLDELDEKTLREAHEIVKWSDDTYNLKLEDVIVVGFLGEGILGMYREGKIYVSRTAFNLGPTIVAGTLYEEWLHRDRAMADESRSLQNHLLNQLMRLADRLRFNTLDRYRETKPSLSGNIMDERIQ